MDGWIGMGCWRVPREAVEGFDGWFGHGSTSGWFQAACWGLWMPVLNIGGNEDGFWVEGAWKWSRAGSLPKNCKV